jgi:ketosteroid isomerase-like protein
MAVDPDFRRAVDANYAALQSLIDGDARPILAVWSHADDVSSFLGYGGQERGWDQVRQRFEWVARRFGGGTARSEELSIHQSGDLGCTVELEHRDTEVDGQPTTFTLRVTHLYRREQGAWKVIHRHADFYQDRQGPG